MKNKVLIITSEFPPGPGGIGNQAYHIARYLKKNGYNIDVYTSSRKEFNDVNYDIENADLHISRYNTHSPFKNLFKAIKYIFNNRKKFDVVLLSGNSPILLTFFIKMFCNWKIITIIHAHEVLMPNGITKTLTKYCLNAADNIIAVSEFARKNLLDNTDLKNEKIITISNGISMDRFANKNAPVKVYTAKDRIKLVTIGSVTPRKGQINVVKALPELIKQLGRVEYHMIGIPQDKELIERVAGELEVTDNIYIHGMLNDEELFKVLADGDIFIMLSENLPNGDVEGFGIAIIEGNLAGLPALGALGCGIDQAISNKYNGILVDSKNANEIAAATREIIDNYEAYSKNAIVWARKHSWDILIQEYIKVINK